MVLHVDNGRALALTQEQVIKRWKQLFGLPMLVEHYHKGITTTKAEADRAKEIIALWRTDYTTSTGSWPLSASRLPRHSFELRPAGLEAGHDATRQPVWPRHGASGHDAPACQDTEAGVGERGDI